jgi:hypothetical protein
VPQGAWRSQLLLSGLQPIASAVTEFSAAVPAAAEEVDIVGVVLAGVAPVVVGASVSGLAAVVAVVAAVASVAAGTTVAAVVIPHDVEGGAVVVGRSTQARVAVVVVAAARVAVGVAVGGLGDGCSAGEGQKAGKDGEDGSGVHFGGWLVGWLVGSAGWIGWLDRLFCLLVDVRTNVKLWDEDENGGGKVLYLMTAEPSRGDWRISCGPS